jgi:hypothetical protein
VRSAFHCELGNCRKVNSSLPASSSELTPSSGTFSAASTIGAECQRELEANSGFKED